ncbi:NAD(P)/FAD-dependent oxidoreductase [Arthrobacter sp. TMN-37]
MSLTCDVLIVGGGIAGLSLASELATTGGPTVVLAEAEPTLGYHTSSRSARQLNPSYGPPVVRRLTARTLGLLDGVQARTGLALTAPRSYLLIGSETDVAARAGGSMHRIPSAEALRLCPQLLPETFEAAAVDTSCVGTDTDALLEYHRSAAVSAGAGILTGARVTAAGRTGGGWRVRVGEQDISAGVVVNAAGAWADGLAELCGAQPRGLVPYRRTAAIVRVASQPLPGTPMVASADDSFYFRRDDAGVLISPCESVPSAAEDARPDPEEVEALIRRLNRFTALGIAGVLRSWTGLRTSPADGVPVVGFDPDADGFFWLAGQGGYGFQTSSAIAELAAAQLTGREPEDAPAGLELAPARLSPDGPPDRRKVP